MQDTDGREIELRYFRDVDKREVDFVVVENQLPVHFIESKTREEDPSPSLLYLKKRFPSTPATQVIFEKDLDVMTKDGIRICSAYRFLHELV